VNTPIKGQFRLPRDATRETHMVKPVEVRAEEDYRLWLRYEDGSEGTVDLSDLAGRGVLATWTDPTVFEAVQISESGAIEWPGGLDLCGDALYMRLTGKSPEEVFPTLRAEGVDA
jgi:hypothetical protein